MEDKSQLLKNIVTDLLSNGKKKNWRDYALECGLSIDKYETCRSRWKSFKKDSLPKGVWGPNDPITDTWKEKLERAMAIEKGEEFVPDAPAGFTTNRMHQQQTKDGGLIWLQSVERDKEIDAAKDFYEKSVTAFENIVLKYEPTKIYLLPVTKPTKWGMNVYISDAHIGAGIKDSLFGIEYNREIYLQRIRAVVDQIEKNHQRYGTFDTINIILAGDLVDGFQSETTRGGHKLVQNLNDAEQFDTFTKSFVDLFNTVVGEGFSQKLRFISATNDNHSGDFGYACSRAVEIYLKARFPDVETIVSRDFIFHVKTGKRIHLICHGKDRSALLKNIPWVMSKDHEAWFENYIQYHSLNKQLPYNQEKQHITLVMGDLHQTKTEFARRFTTKRLMAFTPPNDHSDYNYSRGSGYSGFEIDVFDIDGPETIESRHFFL